MQVGGQRHAPAALPPGKNQYPLYRRLDGPQGQSGRVGKISSHMDSIPGPSPQGFYTRTVPTGIRSPDSPYRDSIPGQSTQGFDHRTVPTGIRSPNSPHRDSIPGQSPQGFDHRTFPTGIRSPDLTACSELLYRLSYPGPGYEFENYLEPAVK